MTEALARLAPKTQDWLNLPPGISELTGSEIAACLAGLHGGPLYVARAAWVGDETVYPDLIAVTLSRASNWFTQQDVIALKAEIPSRPLTALCCAAISQAVEPPKCKTCSGRGVVYPRGAAARDCGACNGTGRGMVGGEGVRRSLSLSRRIWREYEGKYQRIESALWGWKGQAAGHIRRKMADGEDFYVTG